MDINFTKAAELKGHAGPVYALCAGSREGTFFSGSSDGFVAEWDLVSFLPEKFSVKIGQSVYALEHILEFHLLVAGTGSGAFHVIDLKEKMEVRHIVQHTSSIFDVRYNSKQKHLYTVSADGHFCVWEVPTFRLLIDYPICSEKLRNIAVSPSGDKIALACGDHIVREFETEFYNPIRDLNAHTMSVNSVCFTNENTLISGGKDAFLHWWNFESELPYLSVPAHNFAIYAIVGSPDGKLFATGSRDKTVKIWDAETNDFLLRIERKSHLAHTASVNRLYWDKFTGLLVSAGDDRTLFCWRKSVE